uniref:HAUS augmin-like complex subunit 3 N-terminal domain-containing protein n=2 Tax=Clastoptera arizonana TaxID=38151 RepID=A0A1B6DVT9_9HEMI
MDLEFENKLQLILRATGVTSEYQILKFCDGFKQLPKSDSISRFYEWFLQNVNEENCLTQEEIKEYEKLGNDGVVLQGEELDLALNEFYTNPPEILEPFNKNDLKLIKDEEEETRQEVELLQFCYQQLMSDMDRLDKELYTTKSTLKNITKHFEINCKSIVATNEEYSEKLAKLNIICNNQQEHLLRLKESLSIDLDENTTLNSSFTILPHSFMSSNSTLINNNEQQKYLFQMNFKEYEGLNVSYLEDLSWVISKELENTIYNTEIKNKEDSAFLIPFRGLIIDVKEHLPRLCISLAIGTQKTVLDESEYSGINKTLTHLQKLQNDYSLNGVQSDLATIMLETANFKSKIQDLEGIIEYLKNCLFEESSRKWTNQCHKIARDVLAFKIYKLKNLLKKADELLDMLTTRDAYNLFFSILMHQEERQIKTLANFISGNWSTLAKEVSYLNKEKAFIEKNHKDYLEFIAKPVEERNNITKLVASLLKVQTEDLGIFTENLLNSLKTDEENAFKKMTQEVKELHQMRNSLLESQSNMFSTCNVFQSDSSFSRDLEKMNEKIIDEAANLHYIKKEFIKMEIQRKKNMH